MSENKDITNIANRLAKTQNNIELIAKKFNRATNSVQLMAVSKTKPNEDVEAAYQQGQRIFGENYAQELANKASQLAHLKDIEWHYIGPIQSNKTKIIAQAANWIDSLDRIKIAKRLNQHGEELNKVINVLIQVNISNSETKSGVAVEDVDDFAEALSELPYIQLRGLMAIPDKKDDIGQIKNEFLTMKTCYHALQQQYKQIDTLSLGMSGDIEPAIECGSTLVRIGTAIFGARN